MGSGKRVSQDAAFLSRCDDTNKDNDEVNTSLTTMSTTTLEANGMSKDFTTETTSTVAVCRVCWDETDAVDRVCRACGESTWVRAAKKTNKENICLI